MLSAPSRLDFDLWPAASSRQLSAGSDLTQPSVLRLNKIIRHARDVIAYHPAQRSVAGILLVGGPARLRATHGKPERPRGPLCGFVPPAPSPRSGIEALAK